MSLFRWSPRIAQYPNLEEIPAHSEKRNPGIWAGAQLAFVRGGHRETRTRGDTVLTTGGLLSRMRKAPDREATESDQPPVPPQLPQPPPEFPKLLVKYQRGNPVEHVICETIFEQVPYMSGGWYTRPLAELEEVKRQIACAA